MDQVRQEVLHECKRFLFAESALYRLEFGRDVVSGLSIRFVEIAMVAMGNMASEVTTVYDDDARRIVSVTVTDFEKNVSHSKQITVRKEVERRRLRDGQDAISERTNKYGDTVYLVRATDDEIVSKEAAMVSKAVRTCALRVIPGWLQDEAEAAARATQRKRDAEDPDAARRKLADAFAELNVTPADLRAYLGHDLAKTSPAQFQDLRGIYRAIRDGERSWQDYLQPDDREAEKSPPSIDADGYKMAAAPIHDAMRADGCSLRDAEGHMGRLAELAKHYGVGLDEIALELYDKIKRDYERNE